MPATIDRVTDAATMRKRNARALGSFYLYEFLRDEADPPWDQLDGLQQAAARVALQIGASSFDRKKVLGRP